MPRYLDALPGIAPAVFATAVTLTLFTAIPQGFAQNFPVKPIRIVVPFAPGGPNDILARMMGHPSALIPRRFALGEA